MNLPSIFGGLLTYSDRSIVLDHIVEFGTDGQRVFLSSLSGNSTLEFFAMSDDGLIASHSEQKAAVDSTMKVLRDYFEGRLE